MILREGLANSQAKLLPTVALISSMEKREKASIQIVTKIMNEEILGTLDNKSQWHMPVEQKKGESLKARWLCYGKRIATAVMISTAFNCSLTEPI